MRPRRTHASNSVYEMHGGTEDNSLWATVEEDDRLDPSDPCFGSPVVRSVWVPSDRERAAIAEGANIELSCYGAQPPVSMRTTSVALGKPPE